MSDPEGIPCQSSCTPERLRECRAFCCHIGFHLTDKEVALGVARWHPDFPFHILQTGPDSACVHLDPDTLRCRIYENRPSACRAFDCRLPEFAHRRPA